MDSSLHLLVVGNTSRQFVGGWRLDGEGLGVAGQKDAIFRIARLAEDARFDAVFFTDPLNFGDEGTWPFKRTDDFEPMTIAAALSSLTSRIGLVTTGSTSFNAPYNLARSLLSIDHLSAGRGGWNVVTSWAQAAGENFGLSQMRDHDERYRQAEEALDVVEGLWASLADDAVVMDRDSGRYLDVSKVHRTEHDGDYFSVKGLLGSERSEQGQPVIFQAGSSSAGVDFAARRAEVIFMGKSRVDDARQFRTEVADAARRSGRVAPPIVTAMISFVTGATEEEALRAEQEIIAKFQPEHQISILREFGIDLTGADLDGPVPELPATTNAHRGGLEGFRRLADVPGITVREFLYRAHAGFGLHVVGSAEKVADTMQEWIEQGAADGFVVVPPLVSQFELFTRHVVPILQERGIFRREYAGRTLRDHLGLPRPVHPHATLQLESR